MGVTELQRAVQYKITARADEHGSQETAAWKYRPATSCLSLFTHRIRLFLALHNLSAGVRLSDCDPACRDIDLPALPCWSQHLTVLQMALSTWGRYWQTKSGIIRSICRSKCRVSAVNYTQESFNTDLIRNQQKTYKNICDCNICVRNLAHNQLLHISC